MDSGDAADGGPIQIAFAACHGGQEAAARHARERHRNHGRFGGLLHGAQILEAEWQLKTRGLELFFCDCRTVTCIQRRIKKRRMDQSEGFAQRFERGGDQEIAGKLN